MFQWMDTTTKKKLGHNALVKCYHCIELEIIALGFIFFLTSNSLSKKACRDLFSLILYLWFGYLCLSIFFECNSSVLELCIISILNFIMLIWMLRRAVTGLRRAVTVLNRFRIGTGFTAISKLTVRKLWQRHRTAVTLSYEIS